MDLLEGIAAIQVPTTVMVGTRDALTLPKKAEQIVATVPGARLITLQNRGHMLPLEDPDAVTDEIVRAVKGGRSRETAGLGAPGSAVQRLSALISSAGARSARAGRRTPCRGG